VLPTRNRAHLIRNAVDSVFAQSYPQWELLIVDDGSTDDTASIIAELASTDDRIRLIASTGIGGAGARNLGLDAATGSIVTFLDDDNTMTPHWLRAVAEYMSRVPGCDALYGAQLREPIVPGRHCPIDVFFVADFDGARLREQNYIDLGTLAVRNGHPELRFDPELRALQDWEMIARIAAVTPLTPLPALASCYSSAATDRISILHGGDAAVAVMRERFRRADAAQAD
jgi:glycosyltransferase involved in cell wall biosynthesis